MEAVGTPELVVQERRYWLTPPTIQETPAAWDRLFVRYGIHRGITIVQRHDDSLYETRYPAQTELEEAQKWWLGGYRHALSADEYTMFIDAGYGDYVESESA
jgi:hypothetical protein